MSPDYFSHGTSLLFLKGKGYLKRKKKIRWWNDTGSDNWIQWDCEGQEVSRSRSSL